MVTNILYTIMVNVIVNFCSHQGNCSKEMYFKSPFASKNNNVSFVRIHQLTDVLEKNNTKQSDPLLYSICLRKEKSIYCVWAHEINSDDPGRKHADISIFQDGEGDVPCRQGKKEKPLFHISHSSALSRGAVGQAYGWSPVLRWANQREADCLPL